MGLKTNTKHGDKLNPGLSPYFFPRSMNPKVANYLQQLPDLLVPSYYICPITLAIGNRGWQVC